MERTKILSAATSKFIEQKRIWHKTSWILIHKLQMQILSKQIILKIEHNFKFVANYEPTYFCLIFEMDLKDILGHFYDEPKIRI